MVNLSDAILVWCADLTPSVAANPLVDFTVSQVPGGSPTITQWNSATLGTQPTADQLAAVTDAQVTAYYAAINVAAAQTQLADTSTANGRTLQAIMGGANLNPSHIQARVAGTVPLSMYTIASAIFALSSSQKTNIINNLFGGTPPLYQTDTGPNTAAISACYVAVVNSQGVATFNQTQQLIIAAMYTQDNPSYLINPSFDPTINVPGT